MHRGIECIRKGKALAVLNVLHWSDGAMHVWAVSDLEAAELDRFGDLWRKGALPR